MAGMTKTRYVMIAETINRQRTDEHGNAYGRQVQDVITDVAVGLADAFAKDNDQFQRGWFLASAGAVYCQRCGHQLDSYGRNVDDPEQDTADLCLLNERKPGKFGKHKPNEPL